MNADELLRAAREDLAHGYSMRAGTRLRQAAAAGSAEAFATLIRSLLLHHVPGGAREARVRLETAGGAELPPDLQMLRATLRYAGAGGPPELQGTLGDLACAAAAGLAAAAIELALIWHEAGEAKAEAAARGWLTRAAATDPLAGELLALLPPGGAVSSDPPVPPGWPAPRPPAANERLSAKPSIARFRQALDPLECAWVRGVARARLTASLVMDPQTGRPRADPTRTSETMCFDPAMPSVYARRLAARMATLAGRDPACGEPLSILRYSPGQEYKPHYDWLGPAGLARDGLRAAGERAMTALGYLNVPETGGATVFTKLDLRVEPALGDVLVFANLDDTGQPERLSQHAGEPVVAGEKWLASLWIRARPVPLV